MKTPQLSVTGLHDSEEVLSTVIRRHGYDHNDCILGTEPGSIVVTREVTTTYAMCVLKRIVHVIIELSRPDDDTLHRRTGWEWMHHFNAAVIDPDGWRGKDGVRLNHRITVEDFAYRWSASTCYQPAPPDLKSVFVSADL